MNHRPKLNSVKWQKMLEDCTKHYSREYIDNLEKKTIKAIKKVTKNYKNVCSGWIGGKDSLVLDSILRKSGIRFTPIMWRGVNEYPCMAKWIKKNQPADLITEIVDDFDLDFLEKNPEYLFCKGDTKKKWLSLKWKRYDKDIPKHNFDLFIVARRTADRNVCGKEENNFIIKKDKYSTYSPLAKWNHEETLAYIKYNNIKLPPLYNFKRGFTVGSIAMGEWTEYAQYDLTEKEVWDEIYDIDKSIVINASEKLTSAKKYLKERSK